MVERKLPPELDLDDRHDGMLLSNVQFIDDAHYFV